MLRHAQNAAMMRDACRGKTGACEERRRWLSAVRRARGAAVIQRRCQATGVRDAMAMSDARYFTRLIMRRLSALCACARHAALLFFRDKTAAAMLIIDASLMPPVHYAAAAMMPLLGAVAAFFHA